jgi:transposase, IS5 family
MKVMGQKGFWDLEQRQRKLNQKKDVLVTLNRMIPCESFRDLLARLYPL